MKRSVLLICMALLSGCDFTSEALQKEREWKAQEIHDYSFLYTVSCFCGFNRPNPALITVHNDMVTKVEDPLSSISGGVSTVGYPTIDGVFALIAEVRSRKPDRLDVKYDRAYDFPKTVQIDYQERAVDDEIEYKVENFTPLSAGQQ